MRVVGVSALGPAWPTHARMVSASLAMNDPIASPGRELPGTGDALVHFMDNMLSGLSRSGARAFKARPTGTGMSEGMAQGLLGMMVATNETGGSANSGPGRSPAGRAEARPAGPKP